MYFLLKWSLFRGHVSFRGCMSITDWRELRHFYGRLDFIFTHILQVKKNIGTSSNWHEYFWPKKCPNNFLEIRRFSGHTCNLHPRVCQGKPPFTGKPPPGPRARVWSPASRATPPTTMQHTWIWWSQAAETVELWLQDGPWKTSYKLGVTPENQPKTKEHPSWTKMYFLFLVFQGCIYLVTYPLVGVKTPIYIRPFAGVMIQFITSTLLKTNVHWKLMVVFDELSFQNASFSATC